ncbi:major facilitator superfamily domain-containing protein [Fennellomyces sp. T-0311]|nr:major facilitator superfamily domain-containing protein [Fennellomyces sp. T-0311]
MQDYYQRTNAFPEPDASAKLTFVGSLFQGTTFALVFFTNILYSVMGPKRLLILATIVLLIGLILTGAATSISTLYFSLSLCVGFGIGATQAIATRIVPGWFVRYRSTACGIHACMLPFGGLIFPYVMVSINKTLGPSWTFYIIGIVSCMANMVAYTIIRERQPPSNTMQELRSVLDFGVLKNFNLIIWILIHPLHLFAQYIAYAFLPLDATRIGLSDVQGATLVSILSGTSLVGRICTGYAADKIGNLNMYILSMIISTIALWVVWVSARSFGGLVVFALMDGFVCGCFASVVLSLVLAFVGPKDYPAANGIRSIVYITSVFGPLLAGHLESLDPSHPFLYSKIVAGSGAATAGLLALFLKFRVEKQPFAKQLRRLKVTGICPFIALFRNLCISA